MNSEILEQIKAGTFDLIDGPQKVQYILNGVEVSFSSAVTEEDDNGT